MTDFFSAVEFRLDSAAKEHKSRKQVVGAHQATTDDTPPAAAAEAIVKVLAADLVKHKKDVLRLTTELSEGNARIVEF